MVEWLLAVPVKQVRDVATELQPEVGATHLDCVLEVTLTDERVVLLHLEFQGSSSHEPMRFRMLDYDRRLAKQTQLPVCSVVLYVGHSAGARDTGKHQLLCPITNDVVLQWQYRVVHLWKLKAEQLLALQIPALLTLIGQTQIDQPKTLLPQVLEQIRQIDSAERRQRTLDLFISLVNEEEWLDMIEQLIERDDVLDTPMMRRERQWLAQGLEQGLEQGEEKALRHTLSLLLIQRFGELSEETTQRIATADVQQLEQWFQHALRADTLQQVFSDES